MSVIYGNPIIAGGGGLELVANVVDGATVTATLGSKTVTGVSVGGQARLKYRRRASGLFLQQTGRWYLPRRKSVFLPQLTSHYLHMF